MPIPPWERLWISSSSGISSSYFQHFTGEPNLAKSFWSGLIAQCGPDVAGFVEYGTWEDPTSIFWFPWSSKAFVGPPALNGSGSLIFVVVFLLMQKTHMQTQELM